MSVSRDEREAQKKWLVLFANALRSRLERAGLSQSLVFSTPKPRPAEYNGWYVRLGSFKNRKGGPYLFLDRSLETEYRTLWYGIWSPTSTVHEDVIKRARMVWPNIDTWTEDETATRKRARLPFSENPGAGEFYLGKYEWRRPHFDQSPSRVWLDRALNFIAALDKLCLSTSREATSKRVPRAVAARRGQARFRSMLLVACSGQCCVTGSRTESVLEAAHLKRKRGFDVHSVSNGLVLRSDIHTLFDLSLLTIRPSDLVIVLHPALATSEYQKYAGKKIRLPSGAESLAVRRALQQRWHAFQREKNRAAQ
jgi:hypothetical protein